MKKSSKEMYYPLSLKPGYMGRFMDVHQGYDSVYDKQSIEPLQHLERETIIMSTGKELYKPPYIPRPDYSAVNKIVNVDQLIKMPNLSLTQMDHPTQQNVQDFYRLTQLHRDQYMDRTGKLHPIKYFQRSEYMWQCAPEPTRTYTRYPKYNVLYEQPYVLPYTLERTKAFPPIGIRSLAGRYNKQPDISYKR